MYTPRQIRTTYYNTIDRLERTTLQHLAHHMVSNPNFVKDRNPALDYAIFQWYTKYRNHTLSVEALTSNPLRICTHNLYHAPYQYYRRMENQCTQLHPSPHT